MILYWKRVKQWIYLETVIVCDIKVGICSELNENMNLYEYQRSMSFTDLGLQHFQTYFYFRNR